MVDSQYESRETFHILMQRNTPRIRMSPNTRVYWGLHSAGRIRQGPEWSQVWSLGASYRKPGGCATFSLLKYKLECNLWILPTAFNLSEWWTSWYATRILAPKLDLHQCSHEDPLDSYSHLVVKCLGVLDCLGLGWIKPAAFFSTGCKTNDRSGRMRWNHKAPWDFDTTVSLTCYQLTVVCKTPHINSKPIHFDKICFKSSEDHNLGSVACKG